MTDRTNEFRGAVRVFRPTVRFHGNGGGGSDGWESSKTAMVAAGPGFAPHPHAPSPQLAETHPPPRAETSEFLQMAGSVAVGFEGTSKLIERLTKLVGRKGFSNNPAAEISDVMALFEGDMAGLQKDIASLQRYADGQSRGSPPANSQRQKHCQHIVATLRHSAQEHTKAFRDSLLLRAAVEKQQNDRQRIFSHSRGVAPAAQLDYPLFGNGGNNNGLRSRAPRRPAAPPPRPQPPMPPPAAPQGGADGRPPPPAFGAPGSGNGVTPGGGARVGPSYSAQPGQSIPPYGGGGGGRGGGWGGALGHEHPPGSGSGGSSDRKGVGDGAGRGVNVYSHAHGGTKEVVESYGTSNAFGGNGGAFGANGTSSGTYGGVVPGAGKGDEVGRPGVSGAYGGAGYGSINRTGKNEAGSVAPLPPTEAFRGGSGAYGLRKRVGREDGADGEEEARRATWQVQVQEDSKNRVEESHKVEKMIGDLGQMFSRFSTMVAAQEEVVMHIEDDVEAAHAFAEEGQAHLAKYYQVISGNRGIIIKVFLLLLLFIWLFLGVMR